MTPLKLMSFQQYGLCYSHLSILSTTTIEKFYNEFEHEFGERLFLLNELEIQNNKDKT